MQVDGTCRDESDGVSGHVLLSFDEVNALRSYFFTDQTVRTCCCNLILNLFLEKFLKLFDNVLL